MENEIIKSTHINLNFNLNYNLTLKIPSTTIIEEIEKFILSKFVIDDSSHLDILQSTNGKLSKKEKSTIIGMSNINDFNINLTDLFKNVFKSDYSQEDENTGCELSYGKPTFIPSFYLKLDENDIIGSGSFGKIIKCYFQKQKLAIKFLIDENNNSNFKNSFEREINTYTRLSHRNIPKFIGVTYLNGKGKGIIMENIEGTLMTNIANRHEIKKLHYLVQLAEVVNYLHENDIYHRDLKPDNIIVTNDEFVKLIDYGLSKVYNNCLEDKSSIKTIKTLFNSVENPYKCPETDPGDGFYDLWSFGCIVYFLFSDTHPWGGDVYNMKLMYENNKKFYSKANITNPFIYDIINSCCDYNMNNRLSLPLVKRKIEFYLRLLENEKIYQIVIEIDHEVLSTCPTYPDLYENLANSYIETCKFDKAIFCLNKLLFIKLPDLGESCIQVADIYIKLGCLYYNLSDFTNAKKFIEKACLIILNIEKENKILANAYEYAGKIYFIQSIFSSAQDFYQRALDLKLKLFGENSLEVANIYDHFGNLFYSLREIIKAVEFFEKSIKIRSEILQKDDSSIDAAKLFEIKGILEMSKYNYSNAKDHFKKSLKIKIYLFGETHIEIVYAYSYLATSYQYQSKFIKSGKYFDKTIKIASKLVRENNIEIAICYHNIGNDLQMQGQYVKALEYYDKSLKIKLLSLDEVNISVALSHFSIGVAMIGAKDYSQAKINLEISLGISMSLLGEDHFSLKEIYYNLGLANEKMKNHSTAAEFFKISKKPKKECLIF